MPATTGTITIATSRDGPCKQPAFSDCSQPLVITQCTSGKGYVVTHVPTGYSVTGHLSSYQRTRKALKALLALPVDWTRPTRKALLDDVSQDTRSAIRDIIRGAQ